MDIKRLESFLSAAERLSSSLDAFVEEQRALGRAVREKDWVALEHTLAAAAAAGEAVARDEAARNAAWTSLVGELGLAPDTSAFRVSLALPMAARESLTDTCRALRLAAVRARIESEALGSFVGDSASMLAKTLEQLFPDRKVKVYGKSGKPKNVASDAMVVNAAF